MLTATSLSNIPVGGKNLNAVSLRFKAMAPCLAALRTYWITGVPPGYDGGTGGGYLWWVCTDNNGVPGDPLAVSGLTLNLPTQNGRGNFPLVCFGPTKLVPGNFYHLVVRNTDASPDKNWQSLDFLTAPNGAAQTPDIQVLMSAKGVAWEPVDKGIFLASPVALFYSDGTIQGYKGYQVAPGGGLLNAEAYGFPAALVGG